MALKKAVATAEGFTVEYWRVNPTMSVDMVARTADAALLAYKDAAARAAGNRPLRSMMIDGMDDVRAIRLAGADFESAIATGDLRAAMYAQLKTKDFFTGAEDV